MSREKRQTGRYYTEGDPFALKPFRAWAKNVGLKDKTILEPFAGANNIIRLLQKNGFADDFRSFDVKPTDKGIRRKNTMKTFPSGFEVAITNPPWLAKNSAKRRHLPFPETKHDDLYKHCLELCLQNCDYVGALIPATFLQSRLFRERLDTFIALHNKDMFLDTENPVALALFGRSPREAKIYEDESFIGNLKDLEAHLPNFKGRRDLRIKFNAPGGKLGFIAFDNTRKPSIRFLRGDELKGYEIKHTTRMITRIDVDCSDQPLNRLINKLNEEIDKFREKTSDVFLTPFKGLREDGKYRRRMEYSLAREFILKHA